jgi:hypothetical protein
MFAVSNLNWGVGNDSESFNQPILIDTSRSWQDFSYDMDLENFVDVAGPSINPTLEEISLFNHDQRSSELLYVEDKLLGVLPNVDILSREFLPDGTQCAGTNQADHADPHINYLSKLPIFTSEPHNFAFRAPQEVPNLGQVPDPPHNIFHGYESQKHEFFSLTRTPERVPGIGRRPMPETR